MKLPVEYSKLDWQTRRLAREAYIEKQGGNCMWCKSPLKRPPPPEITEKEINWSLFPENFLKYPIHLQHCHATDMTEGAAHAYCNAVMWQYHNK